MTVGRTDELEARVVELEKSLRVRGVILMAVEKRNTELEEALRPFAELAAEMPTGPDWQLNEKFVWGFNNADINLGELRRARKAMQ